jgi:pyruvate ferredoxin oxidoreductase gamma subunit
VFSVRFHGRGGQGVVTAAEMLALAAFDMGLHGQAFPTFGSERTGAPVMAFCRIDDGPIGYHEPIAEPDALVVQDPTLLHQVPLLDGTTAATYLLVNTSRTFAELGITEHVGHLAPHRVTTLAATDIAREVLGRPVPNTALLGALAALTGVVTLDAVVTAIRQRFDGVLAEGNVEAATRAHATLLGRTTPSGPDGWWSRA